MIITAKEGRKLIRDGNAKYEGTVKHGDRERRYAIITRFDPQRTDHYPLKDGEDR